MWAVDVGRWPGPGQSIRHIPMAMGLVSRDKHTTQVTPCQGKIIPRLFKLGKEDSSSPQGGKTEGMSTECPKAEPHKKGGGQETEKPRPQ